MKVLAVLPRVTEPAPLMIRLLLDPGAACVELAKPPLTTPESVSTAPESATVQVCAAPKTTGTLMVTPLVAAPLAMLIPSTEEVGVIVRILPATAPGLSVTEVVADEVLLMNFRSLTVKL